MPVVRQKWIVRQDLRDNPQQWYVFGDNAARVGLGGQAKEMRGEPNAIGVATKWKPDMAPASFFADDPRCEAIVRNDLRRVIQLLEAGATIVVPTDGIGTGLSRLPDTAPQLNLFITKFFEVAASKYAAG